MAEPVHARLVTLEDGSMGVQRLSLHPSQRSQVLQNQDILERIFSHFDQEVFLDDSLTIRYLDSSTRKTLLFVCLACRSFVKPATDLLWRNMESLTPLFRILPTFVKLNNIYTFNGPIQPAHMERFETYARKVRALRIETLSDDIASHCIHRFRSMLNTPLFPALKRISLFSHLMGRELENFSPLFLAHGSLLTSVNIRHISSQNESLVSSFLLHLSHKAPTIQEIALSGDLSSEILHFLNVFRKLGSVSLAVNSSNFPFSTVLQDLRDLPDLHHLYLEVNGNDLEDTTPLIRGQNGDFPALRNLDLRGNPVEMLKALHYIYEAPQLRDISCNFTTNPPPSALSLQRCIAESCRIAPSLKNFHLETARRVIIPAGSPSSNALDPLIQCRQLSSLHVFNVALPLNDAQIREFGESGAWRSLSILYLPLPCSQGPTTSLKSLRTLAQNCPHLTSLTIPIDFRLTSAVYLQQERQYPRAYHPLECLAILKTNSTNNSDPSSTPHMAIAVARFLEYYFPNLAGPKMELMSYTQGDAQWWSVVKANIEEYRALRAEVEADMRRQLGTIML